MSCTVAGLVLLPFCDPILFVFYIASAGVIPGWSTFFFLASLSPHFMSPVQASDSTPILHAVYMEL